MELISATPETLEADLAGRKELEAALGACVPEAWPPVNWQRGPIEFLIDWMRKSPDTQGWFAWYCLLSGTGFQPVESSRTDSQSVKKPRQVGNLSHKTLIGGIGFIGPPNASGDAIVGFSLLADYHRQGLCPEAVSSLVDWAFSHSELSMLIIRTDPHHRPSIRVAEKLGFQYLCPGPETNTVEYALDRSDWMKRPR
jgi:RimJ/RimL family protein N-acetyltransferase